MTTHRRSTPTSFLLTRRRWWSLALRYRSTITPASPESRTARAGPRTRVGFPAELRVARPAELRVVRPAPGRRPVEHLMAEDLVAGRRAVGRLVGAPAVKAPAAAAPEAVVALQVAAPEAEASAVAVPEAEASAVAAPEAEASAAEAADPAANPRPLCLSERHLSKTRRRSANRVIGWVCALRE